jgi:membrane protease YdiL (CAAX protease family)
MFNFSRSQLLDLLSVLSVEVLVFVGLIFLIFLDRGFVRQFYKQGLLFGLLIFSMELPVSLFTYVLLDRTVFESGPGGPSREGIMGLGMVIGLVVSMGVLVLKIGWRGLIYVVAAAEWGRVRPEDGLHRVSVERLRCRRPLLWPLLFGAAVGAFSTFLFHFLGVGLGDTMSLSPQISAQLQRFSLAVRLLISVLFMANAAVLEEVMFRGAIQGFLLRVTRGTRSGIVLSNLLATVIWTMLHLLNTNAPAVKFSQIAFLGLVFGELARRWGLNSAIAAHLGLNLASILAALAVS